MTTVDLGRLPRGQDGQIVIGNTGKSPLWQTVSGDATLAASGALTLSAAFQATQSAWTAYTPTITASSGTFTSVSGAGRYKQIGKTVFVTITITITTNGTAAGAAIATLPVSVNASAVWVFAGRENTATGHMLEGVASGSTVALVKYDNTYPGGDGRTLYLSGVYEAA